ncbi:hypothetical protein Tco_0432900 [Tanacetum coccineum]
MVKIDTEHNVADLLTKGFDAGRHVKRGRDTKIPQSSGPPVKVGDEAVHKELGDRMERAATTASSLEAEQDSDAQTRFETTSKQSNDPPLSRVNTLGSGEDNMKLMELMAHCTTLSELHNWDGVKGITAIIDMKVKVFVSEASIRRHLKLEDSDGISSLHTIEIFEQLALMGYAITSDSLTFQKGHFFPHWKFFIHTILHCLSPKKTAWEQFSSNIATAIIFLATNRTFNFSNLTFEAMEAAPIPYESPLQSVHLLGRDEGSLSLNEVTVLYTSLSNKVESLESELKQTKQTYHVALTKLVKRVKNLEQTIKISQARRRAKVVIFDAEEDEEDPSKQGRSLIEELDLDAGISFVSPYAADQGRIDDPQITRRRQSVENVQTYTRRRREVSTASRLVSIADVSTASELGSTTGVRAKDKRKAIMQESEPPKKIKKRVQVQMSVDEELAKKVFEEEQAKFKAEQEQEKFDFETALELQKQLDEREEVIAQGHDIDWSDLAVLRYHTTQNRPFYVAEVRKNMCMYLKNRGGYKLSHFKGMRYEDIRPIFERVWDQNQAFVPKNSKIEKEQPARGSRKKSLARKRARETLSEENAKKQKLEDTASLEGYDLLLWGDLKTMIEPNEEDEIWRNQQDWNLISWKLHNFCRVHVLLMDTGFVIHMMVEKKYLLSQDTLSKMLSRRLEVDHQKVMEFESAQSNTTAKLPILKLGEYEMWVIRIKQYFQVQDYALWEVIENGNSWVSVPQTAQENGTSVTKMSVPVTAEEKTNKKNDVKARSLLLMALPNEHQLTFSHRFML